MNKRIVMTTFGLAVSAVMMFLFAAVIHFRLLPFLQGDTIKIARGGSMPAEQFVLYGTLFFIVMGCFSLIMIAVSVILISKKNDAS